jgi:hypothetical protein
MKLENIQDTIFRLLFILILIKVVLFFIAKGFIIVLLNILLDKLNEYKYG